MCPQNDGCLKTIVPIAHEIPKKFVDNINLIFIPISL